MDHRLKVIVDKISEFFQAMGVRAVSRSLPCRMACIQFAAKGQEYEILLERSENMTVLGELKGCKPIQCDEEELNALVELDDFGPIRQENGLCRIRIFNRNESHTDLLDVRNPDIVKCAKSESLPKYDLHLADKAIGFLKEFLRG